MIITVIILTVCMEAIGKVLVTKQELKVELLFAVQDEVLEHGSGNIEAASKSHVFCVQNAAST